MSRVMIPWLLRLRLLSLRQRHPLTPVQGLTLLELLVVVTILGVLSAIAIPSFVSYTSRAKQTEARVNVGSMLRGQQAYFLMNNRFANNKDLLELGITDSRFYQYRSSGFVGHRNVSGDRVDGALAAAIPIQPLRGYMGKVWLDDATGAIALHSVTCEGGVNEVFFMDSRTYCP